MRFRGVKGDFRKGFNQSKLNLMQSAAQQQLVAKVSVVDQRGCRPDQLFLPWREQSEYGRHSKVQGRVRAAVLTVG
jgi:hypothetical protein